MSTAKIRPSASDAEAERIPKTGRHALQSASLGRTSKDTAGSTCASERLAVRANQPKGEAVVLAQAQEQVGRRRQLGDPAQAVVRIVIFGDETDQLSLVVGAAVAVCVAQQYDVVPSDHVDCAVRLHPQIHGVAEAFGKRAPLVEPTVVVGIGEHPDAIAGRPLVIFRSLVRVRLDHQQPATAVERQCRWA